MTTTQQHRTSRSAMVAQVVARERQKRADKRWKAAGRYAIVAGLVFVTGWLLMISVGVVHEDWIRTCPTLGYGTAVLLAALVVALGRALRHAIVGSGPR